jgi:subtilisin-like proprotein convertase family protein
MVSRRNWIFAAVSCAALLGVTASASAKVYSSGDIDKKISDLGRTVAKIKVNKDVDISDVNVNVRISHTADDDLLIGLLGPRHEFTELVSQGDGLGHNLGTGPKSCHGTFTTFNDEAATSFTSGSAPYAGSFQPSESLQEYDGDSSQYTWKLYAFDLNQDDHGSLHCWQLDVAS